MSPSKTALVILGAKPVTSQLGEEPPSAPSCSPRAAVEPLETAPLTPAATGERADAGCERVRNRAPLWGILLVPLDGFSCNMRWLFGPWEQTAIYYLNVNTARPTSVPVTFKTTLC